MKTKFTQCFITTHPTEHGLSLIIGKNQTIMQKQQRKQKLAFKVNMCVSLSKSKQNFI